jgi:hypothetical protein
MTTATQPRVTPRSMNRLRLQLFITIILLAIEIVLGISVNLFAKLPAGDKGTSLFTALGAAIASGPVSLAIHAVIGTLIALASISILIRAITTRRALQIVLAIIGLIGVLGAWSSGTGFVGNGADSASFSMATATALAIAAYAIALFAAPAVEADNS